MWSSTCQDSKRGGLVSPPKRSNSENGHSIANFVTPLLHKKENCEHSFFSRVRRVKSLWHMFYFPMEPSQSSPRSLYPIEKVQSAEEKGNIGKGQYERDRLRHFSAEGIESVSKLGSRGHVFHEQQIQDMQVLGVDISSWSKVQRYVFLILTLFAIMLLYGYMQEYVVMTVFQRKLSLFIAVLQLGLISFFAKIQRLLEGKNERVVPMRHYVLLAVFQTTNQSLSYIAMQYVNYTVKVLFKSSRILTTMMFGALYCKRRYPYTDYAAVAFIVVGLIMFINADAKTSSTYDSTGIILLTTSILVDGASLNIQEELMNFYRCRPLEVIFYTNAMSASLMFVLVLCSGELWKGVGFLWKSHNLMNGFLSMVLLSFAGFLNATCVSTITKHFGALVSSISSAIRRALALILSFVLFPKPVVPLHFYGFGILSFGVFIKALPRKEFYNKPEASKAISPLFELKRQTSKRINNSMLRNGTVNKPKGTVTTAELSTKGLMMITGTGTIAAYIHSAKEFPRKLERAECNGMKKNGVAHLKLLDSIFNSPGMGQLLYEVHKAVGDKRDIVFFSMQ